MICPNCGLDNPASARFCSNCGTTLSGSAPPPPPPNAPYNPMGGGPYNQSSQPYNIAGGSRMSPGRAIGVGCLVLVILFFLFMFSCSRSCFFPRRHVYVRRVF